MDRIRVLIVDDNAEVRQGLRSLLDVHEGMEVAGEASNGLEAIEMAAQLLPDVILMDLAMPQLDGIEATRRIRAVNPTTQVVVLTGFGEEEQASSAVAAGAAACLLKNISPAQLIQAIQSAHRQTGQG